ncbi:hypothetical protein DUNSADRAFT_18639 [Dunaliella salina]|uniref:Uncharacterized protein n=1 Tax=Dunaliella salina TaxID=3046 RepID=A0ABQ7GYS6_DUNSA|nr:hypothetical protein DUNSADRAFT_18639 [Dunaliella salina]|eukprot:KAF5839761.1 hypothetical protein DUNSADRAFT_18639 [Dunaliella salina]
MHLWLPSCFGLQGVQACRNRHSLQTVCLVQPAVGRSWSHFRSLRDNRQHRLRTKTINAAAYSEGWPLVALLTSAGGVAVSLDARTQIGAALSAPLLAMGCGIGLSSAGIIPTDCMVYNVVWQYVMPMGAACFLLETDFSRVGGSGALLCSAFLLGAAGMVAGACTGYMLLQIVGLPAAKIPAAMAVDNVAMAACLAALISQSAKVPAATPPVIQESNPGSSLLSSSSSSSSGSSSSGGNSNSSGSSNSDSKSVVDSPSAGSVHDPSIPASARSVESISLTLAMASVSCALGGALASAVGLPNLSLAFMSVIATACAVLGSQILGKPLHSSQSGSLQGGPRPQPLPKQQQRHRQMHMQRGWLLALPSLVPRSSPYAGASQIGGALMAVFFSVIGASAGSLSALAQPETPAVLGFIMVMVGCNGMVDGK